MQIHIFFTVFSLFIGTSFAYNHKSRTVFKYDDLLDYTDIWNPKPRDFVDPSTPATSEEPTSTVTVAIVESSTSEIPTSPDSVTSVETSTFGTSQNPTGPTLTTPVEPSTSITTEKPTDPTSATFVVPTTSDIPTIPTTPDAPTTTVNVVTSTVTQSGPTTTPKPKFDKSQITVYPVEQDGDASICVMVVEEGSGENCRHYDFKIEVSKNNDPIRNRPHCSVYQCGKFKALGFPDCNTIFPPYQELCNFNQ
uniref:Uncharacterized protein n=1 Tax=Caenorhabditis japonica TaxID=281687 RepID=A0A8R1HV87_CAEJA